MIEIEKPSMSNTCYSCGNKENDIKDIRAYEIFKVNSKTTIMSGTIHSIVLCKKCRDELKELLSQSITHD